MYLDGKIKGKYFEALDLKLEDLDLNSISAISVLSGLECFNLIPLASGS